MVGVDCIRLPTPVTMTERVAAGFGSKLRAARERRGITLRQIANATKISPSALEALERNDFSRLPGGIFSRAFVRSYALEVGLDPDETIQEFIAQLPQDSGVATQLTAEHVEDNEALESDRRMAATVIRLLALSIPIAGLVLYFGFTGRQGARSSNGTTQVPTPAPSEAASEGASASTPEATIGLPSQESAEVATTSAPLIVELVATAPCWIKTTIDSGQPAERTLQAGQRLQLEVGRELELTAGDGAALTMIINGVQAAPLGGAGQVVTRRVSTSNFREYLPER
jgi:cytoskeleton protein RodZ